MPDAAHPIQTHLVPSADGRSLPASKDSHNKAARIAARAASIAFFTEHLAA